MWHTVTMFWCQQSVCFAGWLMTCALSIFSVLDNFYQTAPLHSNAVWMSRVLHLICEAHTHTVLRACTYTWMVGWLRWVDLVDGYTPRWYIKRWFIPAHDYPGMWCPCLFLWDSWLRLQDVDFGWLHHISNIDADAHSLIRLFLAVSKWIFSHTTLCDTVMP